MPRPSRARKRSNLLIQLMAGSGLILVGIALFMLLKPGTGSAAPASAAEESVVPVAVSYRAPELSLTDVHGVTGSLADYRGRVVLLNNWATWCPPCKAEMPTLESFYEAHAQAGFTIVAVEAGETQADVLPFMQRYGMTFTVWLDPTHAALDAFHNGNLPNSYVIDRSGMVRYAWTGAISRSMLEQYVTPLIAQAY